MRSRSARPRLAPSGDEPVHHPPPARIRLELPSAELGQVDRPLMVVAGTAQRDPTLHPPVGDRAVQR